MGTTLSSDGITAGFQPFYYRVRKSLATVCKLMQTHTNVYSSQNFEQKKYQSCKIRFYMRSSIHINNSA